MPLPENLRFVSSITKSTYAMILAGDVAPVCINLLIGGPSQLCHLAASFALSILCCQTA